VLKPRGSDSLAHTEKEVRDALRWGWMDGVGGWGGGGGVNNFAVKATRRMIFWPSVLEIVVQNQAE
jgi:hypothetical protein